MNTVIKEVKEYLKTATKSEIEKLQSELFLTERQEKIFNLYLKGKSLDFIADDNFISLSVVNRELKIIRGKIKKLL